MLNDPSFWIKVCIKVFVFVGKLFFRAEKIECIVFYLKTCAILNLLPSNVPEDFESIYAFTLFEFAKSATDTQHAYFRNKEVQAHFNRTRASNLQDIQKSQIELSRTLAVRDELRCDDVAFQEIIAKFSNLLFQKAADSVPMGMARALQSTARIGINSFETKSNLTFSRTDVTQDLAQLKIDECRYSYEREATVEASLKTAEGISLWITENESKLTHSKLYSLYLAMAELEKCIALKNSSKERSLHLERAKTFALAAKQYSNSTEGSL